MQLSIKSMKQLEWSHCYQFICLELYGCWAATSPAGVLTIFLIVPTFFILARAGCVIL